MKIVATSNLSEDIYSERLIAENIKLEEFAKVMCEALNDKYCNEYSRDHYQVKPDEYVLYKWEP